MDCDLVCGKRKRPAKDLSTPPRPNKKTRTRVESIEYRPFDALPNELLEMIFRHLEAIDFGATRKATCVCKRWCAMAKQTFRLFGQPLPSKGFACTTFAEMGYLSGLKWARANECQWSLFTCAGAARFGHLGMLQWLRSNGCRWNEWTCAAAASGGHLGVLQWARTNKCPWDAYAYLGAAENGRLEVMEWLLANDCPKERPRRRGR